MCPFLSVSYLKCSGAANCSYDDQSTSFTLMRCDIPCPNIFLLVSGRVVGTQLFYNCLLHSFLCLNNFMFLQILHLFCISANIVSILMMLSCHSIYELSYIGSFINESERYVIRMIFTFYFFFCS